MTEPTGDQAQPLSHEAVHEMQRPVYRDRCLLQQLAVDLAAAASVEQVQVNALRAAADEAEKEAEEYRCGVESMTQEAVQALFDEATAAADFDAFFAAIGYIGSAADHARLQQVYDTWQDEYEPDEELLSQVLSCVGDTTAGHKISDVLWSAGRSQIGAEDSDRMAGTYAAAHVQAAARETKLREASRLADEAVEAARQYMRSLSLLSSAMKEAVEPQSEGD